MGWSGEIVNSFVSLSRSIQGVIHVVIGWLGENRCLVLEEQHGT